MKLRGAKIHHWLAQFGKALRPRAVKQLRLCETLPLGERRFLAVVQFEQQKFLIGTAGNSIALLTPLGGPNSSQEIRGKQII